MILKESQIDPDTIKSVIGKPYKKNGQLLTATGSSFFFVRYLVNQSNESILRWDDSKAIFQRHTEGLALYVNRSNYQRVILLKNESIRCIKLIRSVEKLQSDSSVLPALSEIIRKASLGLIRIPSVITQKETHLIVETDAYKGFFTTNFSSFNELKSYFGELGLGERFITIT